MHYPPMAKSFDPTVILIAVLPLVQDEVSSIFLDTLNSIIRKSMHLKAAS